MRVSLFLAALVIAVLAALPAPAPARADHCEARTHHAEKFNYFEQVEQVGLFYVLYIEDGPALAVPLEGGCYRLVGFHDVIAMYEGTRNPPAAFCYVVACIPNFWNGRGYVVMCADGMFSKSGGIRGACNYHGGPVQML